MKFREQLSKIAATIRLILAAIRLWTPRQKPDNSRQLKRDDNQQNVGHLPTPPSDPTELLERLQGKR